MAQHQVQPSAAEQALILTGGGTFNSVTVPPGIEPETLVVLDHILTSTNNGTANGTMTIGSRSLTFYRKTIVATGPDYTDLNWSGGQPQWTAASIDGEPYRYPEKYETQGTSSYSCFGGTAGSGETSQKIGFSFTSATDATVYAIGVRLFKVGNPTDDVTLDIGITSFSTAPTATTRTINGGSLTTSPQWVYFYFNSTQTIASGTKYFCRLIRSGARDTNNYYKFEVTTSGGPAGGGANTMDNSLWNVESGTDDANYRIMCGVSVSVVVPASSTSTTVLVTYHYEDPSNIRP